MRAVQTQRYLYLFNPWSNGTRVFATATTGTATFRRLATLAKTDSKLAARLELYKHRVPEELYDVVKDPDCLHNLIDSPKHQAELKKLRATLDAWMVKSKDPTLEAFRKREDKAFVEAYVQQLEKEASARPRNKRPKKNPKNKPNKGKKK